MKPRACFFFTAVLLVAATMAAQAAQFGDFQYESSGINVTITNYTGAGGAVAIPDRIEGLPVIAIGRGATGSGAFEGCTSLTRIRIPKSVTRIGNGAFCYCISLSSMYFEGNMPTINLGLSCMGEHLWRPTVYYLPGTTGWGALFDRSPTALWLPQVLTNDGSFGMQTNGFGFTIDWASDRTVVVEATTNLSNPIWTPLGTNTLVDGVSYFSDHEWANHSGRFYRLRWP